MNRWALACFACSAVCAITMQIADARMQRYRSQSAPAAAFRWVPLRWWNPALYVGDGQRYRKVAIRSWWMMVMFFAAGALIVASGN